MGPFLTPRMSFEVRTGTAPPLLSQSAGGRGKGDGDGGWAGACVPEVAGVRGRQEAGRRDEGQAMREKGQGPAGAGAPKRKQAQGTGPKH